MNSNERIVVETRKYSFLALYVNISMTGIKFIVGILGNSQSVVADAFHSLSDILTDLLVLVGVGFWTAPPDRSHPYGHSRIETIVTASIGIILAYVGIKIGYKALVTAGDNHQPPLFLATLGPVLCIIFKTWLYSITISFGKRIKSSAVIANAKHQLSDVVSSIPALIGSLVPAMFPGMVILDHIGAIIVALFILNFSWGILKPAMLELSDAGMDDKQRRSIIKFLTGIEEIHAVNNFRSRKVGDQYMVDMTILINEDLSLRASHDAGEQIKVTLMKKYPQIKDIVLHVEPVSSETKSTEFSKSD